VCLLLYQQGGCVTTHAVEDIRWKQYGLNQPGGGIPVGPAILLIHVASINVPFTSESKDAIADIPVIKDEVNLAIKDVARKLKPISEQAEQTSRNAGKKKLSLQRYSQKWLKRLQISWKEMSLISTLLLRRLWETCSYTGK